LKEIIKEKKEEGKKKKANHFKWEYINRKLKIGTLKQAIKINNQDLNLGKFLLVL
jgi:hypothetical protein